jgi:hypothetical protein
MSALPPIADIGIQPRNVRFGPCVDGSELARRIFTFRAEFLLVNPARPSNDRPSQSLFCATFLRTRYWWHKLRHSAPRQC